MEIEGMGGWWWWNEEIGCFVGGCLKGLKTFQKEKKLEGAQCGGMWIFW